jgi:hypothetical protein
VKITGAESPCERICTRFYHPSIIKGGVFDMKARLTTMIALLLLMSVAALGQMIPRQDVKWARKSPTPITVDGILNEPAWAVAESVNVVYGQSSGMPGSGWFDESPTKRTPSDPTRATVKFLTYNDSLYVAFIIKDSSVGGGTFNKFDGILSNIRRKDDPNRPVRDGEIFYAWCSEGWADTLATTAGRMPAFLGGLAGGDVYHARKDSLKGIWDAATTVQGTQNDDATVDQGYTIEFKINLKARGYNITQPAGDIAMYSFSIYDADWQWPLNTSRFTGNRVWYQCPWGNANAYNHIRIYARPDVTTSSGPAPTIGPELTIPGTRDPSPVIDGTLNEPVWNSPGIGTLQIQFGNSAIRNAYPSTAPFRSGQFQPAIKGVTASVTDPNLATVKYFYKADTLFLGFDVLDQVVQFRDSNNQDLWDGFRVVICARDTLNGDNVLWPLRLTFIVAGNGTNGVALRREDIAAINDAGKAGWDSAGTKVQVALKLKGGTTIDTVGLTADSGYTAEMKINLRALGYPAGRGDGVLFFAVTHFDGDSFTPASLNYGTRTWFMREGSFNDGAAWAYMDPNALTGVNDKGTASVPKEFVLLGNYPNPFNPATTIKFVMPQTSLVTLEVFDVLGRLVSSQSLGLREAGEHAVSFNAANLASGMYNYRLRMASNQSTVVGKMMLLK